MNRVIITIVSFLLAVVFAGEPVAARPNMIVILADDMGYGDVAALNPDSKIPTPNLDRLASQGVRYTRAFTPAGVCAVVRAGIIAGMVPISFGTQHMRTSIAVPDGVLCFPQYLRRAGYFCTNKSKTDYQMRVNMSEVWDRQGGGRRDDPAQPVPHRCRGLDGQAAAGPVRPAALAPRGPGRPPARHDLRALQHDAPGPRRPARSVRSRRSA